MAEVQFADGKRLVDDPIAGIISEATGGSPERFTFKDAMRLFNKVVEQRHLRKIQDELIAEHFRTWGR